MPKNKVLSQRKRKNNNNYFLLQVKVKYRLDDIFYKVTNFTAQEGIINFSSKIKILVPKMKHFQNDFENSISKTCFTMTVTPLENFVADNTIWLLKMVFFPHTYQSAPNLSIFKPISPVFFLFFFILNYLADFTYICLFFNE